MLHVMNPDYTTSSSDVLSLLTKMSIALDTVKHLHVVLHVSGTVADPQFLKVCLPPQRGGLGIANLTLGQFPPPPPHQKKTQTHLKLKMVEARGGVRPLNPCF